MTGATDTAATVIIGQRIRAGEEQAFEAWQLNMNREAAKYPGFIAAEINQPTAVQSDWVIVYRFDSIAHVQAWLNSATRQELLLQAEQYFEGPGTQQVIGGAGRQSDPLVTVVVTHRVDPADVDEFLAWQDRLRLAESSFPGFRGTELFRPVEGIQEEWTRCPGGGSSPPARWSSAVRTSRSAPSRGGGATGWPARSRRPASSAR